MLDPVNEQGIDAVPVGDDNAPGPGGELPRDPVAPLVPRVPVGDVNHRLPHRVRRWRATVPDEPSSRSPRHGSPDLVLAALVFVASQAPAPDPVRPDPNAPRPIAARDTVFIEDMTWMEVRDAMKAGKDTVIVATGGIEQNGPYLATGKHNFILRATTEAIARKLGNALVGADRPVRPRGRHRPAHRAHEVPRHDQPHRGHLPGRC